MPVVVISARTTFRSRTRGLGRAKNSRKRPSAKSGLVATPPGCASGEGCRCSRIAGRSLLDHLRALIADASDIFFQVAVDCANGATTTSRPACPLDRLDPFGSAPSRRPHIICTAARRTRTSGAGRSSSALHDGVAFDGYGDRAIFVDEAATSSTAMPSCDVCARCSARAVSIATSRRATVMTTLGCSWRWISRHCMSVPFGDKYVMEEMLARGLSLAASSRPHHLLDYRSPRRLCTALNAADPCAYQCSLAELPANWAPTPQVLRTPRVRQKVDLSTVPRSQTHCAVEERLGARPLARPHSGTEPSCEDARRVNEADIHAWGPDSSTAFKRELDEKPLRPVTAPRIRDPAPDLSRLSSNQQVATPPYSRGGSVPRVLDALCRVGAAVAWITVSCRGDVAISHRTRPRVAVASRRCVARRIQSRAKSAARLPELVRTCSRQCTSYRRTWRYHEPVWLALRGDVRCPAVITVQGAHCFGSLSRLPKKRSARATSVGPSSS